MGAKAETSSSGSAGLAPGTNQARWKVRIDASLTPVLRGSGATMLADYGGYQVIETESINPEWLANGLAEVRDDYNELRLNSRRIKTSYTAFKSLKPALAGNAGKGMYIVQFTGPVRAVWRENLVSLGVRIVSYIPHNAYLVYGDAASLARVRDWSLNSEYVQWAESYAGADKFNASFLADLSRLRAGEDFFAVQLALDDEENAKTLGLLERLKLDAIKRQHVVMHYVNVVVRLSRADLPLLAEQPDVISIQPYPVPRKFCERQAQIIAGNLSGFVPIGPGYLNWLTSKGFSQAQFDASGFLVDLTDSGVDNGTSSPNHFGLRAGGVLEGRSRIAYARLVGTPNPGSVVVGCDGHGTLNAHIMIGYDDRSDFPFTDLRGFHYGLGACPFVSAGSSVIFDPNDFTYPNYNTLLSQAYQDGARISNNSWGSSASGAYDIDAQSYDALVRDAEPLGSFYSAPGNQQMVILFAAGNDGPNLQTIGSPGAAKNVITVGGAEGVQSIGGIDSSNVGDLEADNADDLFSYSSRGPCADGRHKPDLVAPSTHISGGVAQEPHPAPQGTAVACYNGVGVSGGANSIFFPSGQQYYTASSGTSHAAPSLAGACALLRQRFLNLSMNPPSAAMTKAYLLNSARYLSGVGAGDTLWSDAQGMGELDLGRAFDEAPRVVRDELADDIFTTTGQTRTFTGFISDTNKPFRVTLAWTDAPGSTTASAYNNDLDLTVVVDGKLYKGNVFSGAYSIPGGSTDFRNNVESVFLPAGVTGSFLVTVTAANINSDGVPNNNQPLDQDFALVIYNGTNSSMPAVVGSGSSLVFESLTPNNGAIDPLETVTVSFALKNIGTADTTNLLVRLEETGEIIHPDGPQVYGVLKAGGPPLAQSFTFIANAACGQAIQAMVFFQDKGNSLGSFTFSLPVGKFVPTSTFSENFDSVTVPKLPVGWSTSVDGAGVAWLTTNTIYDSGPISAYVGEPDLVGLSELISPLILIKSPAAELLFRNRYSIEADAVDASRAFDGGVLEIAIGNGPFEDILTAGGSFSSGGYNRIVDPNDDNPLAGRQVWGGDSGGFITSKVALPSVTSGRYIRLKWKFGTDTSNFLGGYGWFIDTISVRDGHYECMGPGLVAPNLLSSQTNGGRIVLSFQSVAGQGYVVQYAESAAPTQWNTLFSTVGDGTVVTVTDTVGPTQRYYRLKSP